MINISSNTSSIDNCKVFDATDAFSTLYGVDNVPFKVIGCSTELFTLNAISNMTDKLNEMFYAADTSAAALRDAFSHETNVDNCKIPTPKKIYRSGKTTTVLWDDDTTTIVNLREGNEDSVYTAFAYAVTKKIFGSMKKITRLVDSIDSDQIHAREKAERAARREEQEARHKANLAKKASQEIGKKIGFADPSADSATCPTCLL